MQKQHSNFISYLTLILATAAFINSWLSNSPTAVGAPNYQDNGVATQAAQPVTDAQTDQASISLQGAAVSASVPSYIGYQGVLRDAEGKLLTRPVTVTFRIYDNVTTATPPTLSDCKATNPCKWAEVHKNVTMRDGRFSVLLGNVSNPITPTLMTNPDRFVGVQVEGYQEMQPRQRFSSVPYAMWSERAAHANTLSAPDGNLMDAVYVNNDGNVGIGTTSPTEKLQVMGSTQIGGNAVVGGNLGIGGNTQLNGGATVLGSFAYENVGHRLNFSSGADVDLFTSDDSLWINSQNGNIRLNPWSNTGDVEVGHSLYVSGNTGVGGDLNMGGRLTIKGIAPIVIRRYENKTDEFRTIIDGVNVYEWRCIATSWKTGAYQDADSTIGEDAVWTYGDGQNWWIEARFDSEGPHETPSVEAVCFRNEIVDFGDR